MEITDYTIIEIIEKLLEQPVSIENYDRIHGAIIAGKKHQVRHHIMVDKYLELVDFKRNSHDIRAVINVLEEAREISKTDYRVIYRIGKYLSSYWKIYGQEFCVNDNLLLGQYLQRVDDGLHESKFYYSLKSKLGALYLLQNKVRKTEQTNSTEIESKHTNFFSQLINKQYADLTDDERTQRVAEIFERGLRKSLKEATQNSKVDDSEQNNATD